MASKLSNTSSIKIAVAALIIFTLSAIVAGFIIPFNVEQSATVQVLSGDVMLLIKNETPESLATDTQTDFKSGQTIQLQPGSEASITFTINKGRAHLTGPTMLTLVESHRRATTPGHTFDSFSSDYVLTLEQTQGTIRYSFANTSPALDKIKITIQLPDGNYIPTLSNPCWTITVNTAGQSTVDTIPCPQTVQQ